MRIELEIGDAQGTAEQLTRPPQLRFQPRNQLLKRERLHQIIVGAAAQSVDPIVQAAAGGEHEDGDRIVAMTEFAQQLKAIAVGEPEVENQRGVERGLQDASRLFDVGQSVRLIARGLQALGQELRQLFVVFDDQQTHIRPVGNIGAKSWHTANREPVAHCGSGRRRV